MFERIGTLADIANYVVFRNVRGTEKFIKGKLICQKLFVFYFMHKLRRLKDVNLITFSTFKLRKRGHMVSFKLVEYYT